MDVVFLIGRILFVIPFLASVQMNQLPGGAGLSLTDPLFDRW